MDIFQAFGLSTEFNLSDHLFMNCSPLFFLLALMIKQIPVFFFFSYCSSYSLTITGAYILRKLSYKMLKSLKFLSSLTFLLTLTPYQCVPLEISNYVSRTHAPPNEPSHLPGFPTSMNRITIQNSSRARNFVVILAIYLCFTVCIQISPRWFSVYMYIK